jgi:ferredoxin-NADP reductase/predicted pyridoxine 5'-phosphate oxidase superfamily flavin-nucleotide-binding protein
MTGSTTSVFHAGERAIQTRVGVRERIDAWASRIVRPFMPDQHRAFYEALPFLVAAARDGDGRPWVTLLAGAPGFVAAPDPRTLRIGARPGPGDALAGALDAGGAVGLLGIDLAARRRNRLNGRAVAEADGGLTVTVDQSFGNCPQYIGERPWRAVDPAALRPRAERRDALDASDRAFIAAADTGFVGSGTPDDDADDPRTGLDASHRGGPVGFVEVVDANTLVLPDYAGNHHYNTLGNLLLDPRIALTFVDFATGGLLQLTGRAEVDLDPAPTPRHPGALRLVRVTVDAVARVDDALALRWDEPAAAKLDLRVTAKVRESADVVSLELAPQTGTLPPFAPGQHLPLEFAVEGVATPVTRTYSLSGAPGAARWRISVKREEGGLVSRFLHDTVDVGTRIGARPPAGDFVLHGSTGAEGGAPVILIAAGVGITPLAAMLHALANGGSPREVVLVHGVRDGEHAPLAAETRALVDRLPNGRAYRVHSRPGPDDAPDAVGRIDAERLAGLELPRDADVWLCGPPPFLADVLTALETLGVDPARLHAESFGPSST